MAKIFVELDTSNPRDASILTQFQSLFCTAQPVVADSNAGSPSLGIASAPTPTQQGDGAVSQSPAVAPAAAGEASDKKARKAKKPEVEAPPAPVAAESSSTTAQETNSAFTLDHVREALSSYTQKHSLEKGIEILASYGAKRISELKPEQYGEFVSACGV